MQAFYNINIDYSINSGQVFLWKKDRNSWYGIDGSNVFAIREYPQKIETLNGNKSDFFRESDDLEKIFQSIRRDKIVAKAIEKFPGLRLMRQDPFQCYISFIVSSNSNIPKIKQVLWNLCIKFGNAIKFDGKEFFLFPEPEKLANAPIDVLRNCGLGYRAEFVKKSSLAVTSGIIDFEFLKRADYNDAKESLKNVFGIGDKVADCIMLFSLEKLEAFPLDIWMQRILEKYYSDIFDFKKTLTERNYNLLHEKIVKHFGPFAGYSQQFLFKMERDLNQKKWL